VVKPGGGTVRGTGALTRNQPDALDVTKLLIAAWGGGRVAGKTCAPGNHPSFLNLSWHGARCDRLGGRAGADLPEAVEVRSPYAGFRVSWGDGETLRARWWAGLRRRGDGREGGDGRGCIAESLSARPGNRPASAKATPEVTRNANGSNIGRIYPSVPALAAELADRSEKPPDGRFYGHSPRSLGARRASFALRLTSHWMSWSIPNGEDG